MVERRSTPGSPSPGGIGYDFPLEPSETKCAITGVNGFLARHLAFQLLAKGYHVVGTVRFDVNDMNRVEASMPYYQTWNQIFQNRFTLHQVNLIQEETMYDAFKGCYCVFHTASPILLPKEPSTEEEAEEMYYKPAVEGTKHVLQACEYCEVDRVVITSSTYALYNPFNPPRSGIVSECDWNMSSKMSEPNGAYKVSKIKAEKFAWEFCRYLTSSHKIQLAAVLPTFVLGPVLPTFSNVGMDASSIVAGGLPGSSVSGQPAEDIKSREEVMIQQMTHDRNAIAKTKKALLTSSVLETFKLLTEGKSNLISLNLNAGFSDVRDVAKCHILAMEKRVAKGNRFIVCQSTRNLTETVNLIGNTLKNKFHVNGIHYINPTDEDKDIIRMKKIDGGKIEKVFGFQYIPFEKTIDDMCQSWLDLQFI